jgi:sulfur relay protein TusB/DsrH
MVESNPSITCLHLIVSTSAAAVNDCLHQFSAGDAIVFLDGGVMHLLGATGFPVLLNNPDVCFSREDLLARSLLKTAKGQGVVVKDDRAVVSLLLEHDHCLTWT